MFIVASLGCSILSFWLLNNFVSFSLFNRWLVIYTAGMTVAGASLLYQQHVTWSVFCYCVSFRSAQLKRTTIIPERNGYTGITLIRQLRLSTLTVLMKNLLWQVPPHGASGHSGVPNPSPPPMIALRATSRKTKRCAVFCFIFYRFLASQDVCSFDIAILEAKNFFFIFFFQE